MKNFILLAFALSLSFKAQAQFEDYFDRSGGSSMAFGETSISAIAGLELLNDIEFEDERNSGSIDYSYSINGFYHLEGSETFQFGYGAGIGFRKVTLSLVPDSGSFYDPLDKSFSQVSYLLHLDLRFKLAELSNGLLVADIWGGWELGLDVDLEMNNSLFYNASVTYLHDIDGIGALEVRAGLKDFLPFSRNGQIDPIEWADSESVRFSVPIFLGIGYRWIM